MIADLSAKHTHLLYPADLLSPGSIGQCRIELLSADVVPILSPLHLCGVGLNCSYLFESLAVNAHDLRCIVLSLPDGPMDNGTTNCLGVALCNSTLLVRKYVGLRTSPSPFSFFDRIPNTHMPVRVLKTSGLLSNEDMQGSFQNDAVIGCSCNKYRPPIRSIR